MAVKFIYFDGRGIGDPIRWVLSYGGVEFEDVRIPYDAFPPTLPPEIKAKCRWGQVPLVEFDGKTLVQTLAICRFFAKKCNLVPEDEYQAALCDEYVDAIRDMMNGFYAVIFENDEQKKKEKLKDTLASSKSRFLNVFDSIVKSNDGKHLIGNSVTWADIWLAFALEHFESKSLLGVSLVDGHASLKNLLETVTKTPGIKEWLEKRPKTKY